MTEYRQPALQEDAATKPKIVTFTGAQGLVGVDVKDLEAVNFAFGFLMSQEAHIHAGALHSLRNRIRMVLTLERPDSDY